MSQIYNTFVGWDQVPHQICFAWTSGVARNEADPIFTYLAKLIWRCTRLNSTRVLLCQNIPYVSNNFRYSSILIITTRSVSYLVCKCLFCLIMKIHEVNHKTILRLTFKQLTACIGYPWLCTIHKWHTWFSPAFETFLYLKVFIATSLAFEGTTSATWPASGGTTSDDVVHPWCQSIVPFCYFTFEFIAVKPDAVLGQICKQQTFQMLYSNWPIKDLLLVLWCNKFYYHIIQWKYSDSVLPRSLTSGGGILNNRLLLKNNSLLFSLLFPGNVCGAGIRLWWRGQNRDRGISPVPQ